MFKQLTIPNYKGKKAARPHVNFIKEYQGRTVIIKFNSFLNTNRQITSHKL